MSRWLKYCFIPHSLYQAKSIVSETAHLWMKCVVIVIVDGHLMIAGGKGFIEHLYLKGSEPEWSDPQMLS